MPANPSLVSVVIIGGGASGLIMAAHLLRRQDYHFRVTIVERTKKLGEGVAYSTNLPEHLLNVSVQGMSALADDRAHFQRWLAAFSEEDVPPGSYVARSLYGAYLNDLLDGLHAFEDGKRFHTVESEATFVNETAVGIDVKLANGSSVIGHVAILATGHELPRSAESVSRERPSGRGRHVIFGSGLTMVDQFLRLERNGFDAPVVAISRHGLLPHPHNQAPPLPLDVADIPLGTELSFLLKWFRRLVRDLDQDSVDWRSVVDGLRPHAQRIWKSWPATTKRRFLRHLRPWWSIHRHRIAPVIHQQIAGAVNAGKLRLIAGVVTGVDEAATPSTVKVRERFTTRTVSFPADRLHDCTGLQFDIGESGNGLLKSLFEQGVIRPDDLTIGLDVNDTCAVIDANGAASRRLYAVGPVTRGTFFEIESIPEIRQQCAALTSTLVDRFADRAIRPSS